MSNCSHFCKLFIVAPTSIALNVPETFIEGEEFEFNCNSTDASPKSSYIYSTLTYIQYADLYIQYVDLYIQYVDLYMQYVGLYMQYVDLYTVS